MQTKKHLISKSITMKNILLVFIFLTIVACDSSQKATGHWHIYSEKDRFKTIWLLDVEEDSIAYWSNPLYGKEEGLYIPGNRQLLFPGECGSGQFDYHIIGDNIILNGEYAYTHRGYRCDDKCCTPIEDFKINFKVDVQFPQVHKLRDSLHIVEFKSHRYREPVVIGKLKPDLNYFYENEEIFLELDGKLAQREDIKGWLNREKSYLNESQRPLLSFKFIVDKDIALKDLKPIVEEFRKYDAPKIWITCLKPDYMNQEQMFEHVRVIDIDLNQNLTLNKILR